MYVFAPIRNAAAGGNEIIGAVSVGKPVQSFGQFVDAARKKTLLLGATAVIAVLLLVLILSVWLVRPFGLISDYVRYVRAQRSFSLAAPRPAALGSSGRPTTKCAMRPPAATTSPTACRQLTHELKGPLSSIRGAAELLQEPMPDAIARFNANILRETERIQQFVDRMIELTVLEQEPGHHRARGVATVVAGAHCKRAVGGGAARSAGHRLGR